MTAYDIRPFKPTSADDFGDLLDTSKAEGYGFIDKLWIEYESRTQRFDAQGAILLGVYAGERLTAVGGVCPDPYLNQADIGRIRHVYVLPDYRRTGVGRLLMHALINHARRHFTHLTLRTMTVDAAAFYVALGFSDKYHFEQATHWKRLGIEL